jgi:methenyltetrahydrofolate cyclohydrolase
MGSRRETDLPSLAAFVREGDGDGRAASSAVAALTVALATDLIGQVAEASVDWDDRGGALAQADALRARALELAGEAEEAFADALAALEQAAIAPSGASPRSDAELGSALDLNVQILLGIGAAAGDAAELAGTVARDGEPTVRADAVAASMLAVTAAEIATHLIEVNLLIGSDDDRAGRARQLLTTARSNRDDAQKLTK